MEIFFRSSRAAYSVVRDRIWPNFELIRDFMNVLVTCKNEDDSSTNKGARVAKTFPHYKSNKYEMTRNLSNQTPKPALKTILMGNN